MTDTLRAVPEIGSTRPRHRRTVYYAASGLFEGVNGFADRLKALGFIWDVLAEQWEIGFQNLEAYVHEQRHCRVPSTHVTADGYRLGQWVKVQRRREDKTSAERKARLDALGFEWQRRPAAE